MRVALRYHGIVRDLVKPRVDAIELADGATVGELIEALGRDNEATAAVLRQTQVIIDGQRVTRETVLAPDAVVGFMRPIAGGCPLTLASPPPAGR